jgi:putative polyketide hydroxylase
MPDDQSRTTVLIVGGGYAGLASSLFLSAHGVPSVLADRHPAVSVQGRARGINQRTMELYRPLGLEPALRGLAGISRTGPGVTQRWVSIVIDADLDNVITRRALFWIVLNERLGFASFVTTATPGRWAVSVTYDPQTTTPADFTDERCTQIAHAALGRADIPVKVVSVGAWEQAVGVADAYRSGRVFLVGDAAHVWPPAGAMGANSAVQDASNLAWKLGAVHAGLAGDALLDSYEAERRQVALALADLTVRRQAARFGGGLDDDIDDLVLTLGQRYRSTAILGGVPSAPFGAPVADRPEAGARMPHVWLTRGSSSVSSHDLFTGGFVLLAGPDGTPWLAAADRARTGTGARLDAYRIGTDLGDPDGAWPRFALPDGAAVLVRPDGYVAWIGEQGYGAGPALTGALRRLLSAR